MAPSTSLLVLLSQAALYCSITTQVTGQMYSDYACPDDTISLQCPDNKNISITEGSLGQYDSICPDTEPCCSPDKDADCRGDLEELFPSDMVDLRAECDGQNSCSYRVLGGSLDHCGGTRQAQYLQVYHRCVPEDPTTVPPPTTEEPTSQAPTTTTTTTTRQPPPIPQTTPTPGDDGLSGGVIAAIVIGVLLLIAIAVLVAIIIWRKLHPPPKPKKVVKRRVGKKSTVVYDNQAFASSNQVVIHLDQESKVLPNGVHNNNGKKTASGPAPMSDGKRKTKPVTAAESFRYAQEKDLIASKYKADGKPKVNKRKQPKTPTTSNEGDYYNMDKSKPLKDSNTNVYENVS